LLCSSARRFYSADMFLPEPKKPGAQRRRLMPGQSKMLWSSLMIAAGSFMPWISTGFGNISGATGQGAGYWTFIAAMLGVSGALMPWRKVAITHAIIVALVATLLPLWQVLHLVNLVGLSGWMPGIGLVLVFFGGLFVSTAARTLINLEVVPVPQTAAA
jgi:hypothetical protein